MVKTVTLGLHPAQKQIYDDPSRSKLLIASRRFGKTRLLTTTAILKTLSFNGHYDKLSPPVTLLATETLKQCKALFWEPLVHFFEPLPCTKKINRQDNSISFFGNKPTILLRGFDSDGDAVRGLKLYFAGIDEVQMIDEVVWNEVITPALADTRGSSSLLIGTPKGKVNIAYKLAQDYQKRKDCGYFHKTVYDNPHFPREEIQRLKETLSERSFRQELLAEFVDFSGKIFTEYSPDKMMTPLEWAANSAYYIGIDPGVANIGITLFRIDDQQKFYILKTFASTEIMTVDDLCNKVIELKQEVEANKGILRRVYVPDDRVDIKISLNRAGFDQAILVKRSAMSPNQRAEIMNNLFKQNRILVHSAESSFSDELQSYHRNTDSMGNILDTIAPHQKDHRIDSFLYPLSRLVLQDRSFFNNGTSLSDAA